MCVAGAAEKVVVTLEWNKRWVVLLVGTEQISIKRLLDLDKSCFSFLSHFFELWCDTKSTTSLLKHILCVHKCMTSVLFSVCALTRSSSEETIDLSREPNIKHWIRFNSNQCRMMTKKERKKKHITVAVDPPKTCKQTWRDRRRNNDVHYYGIVTVCIYNKVFISTLKR